MLEILNSRLYREDRADNNGNPVLTRLFPMPLEEDDLLVTGEAASEILHTPGLIKIAHLRDVLKNPNPQAVQLGAQTRNVRHDYEYSNERLRVTHDDGQLIIGAGKLMCNPTEVVRRVQSQLGQENLTMLFELGVIERAIEVATDPQDN
jgi:hypothetical protein